jgi:outer membrane protein TolC
MAISVAFGLLFVTVVILVLLPIYLMWINPLHRSWVWVKKGDWISRESAEPAVREERGFAPKTLPMVALGLMAWGLSPEASAQIDLTREHAVAMALEQHYGIRLAHGQRDLAKVGNAWGAAGALPRLTFTAGAGTNVNDQTENPSTFLPIATESQSVSPGLQVQWTLFDGMAMFANKDRLGLLAEQAEGNVELMVESTVQAVLTAYDNVLVQEESLEVLQAAMDLTQERLDRLDASLALGTARTFDRLQFQNALLTDSAGWLRQRVASRAARRNLNLLLAAPDDQAWSLTSGLLDPISTGDMALAQARLAGENTSVSNAVLVMQLAEVGVRQAKARLSPVLGLTANWGNTAGQSRAVSELPPQLVFNPYENGDIQSFVTNYGAQLTLNFNLFNGGATRRAIQQAQVQVELAGLDRDRLLLEAQSALAQAWDRRAAAEELYTLAQRRTENARLAAQLGADRYRDGVLNALDFRALDVALLQAEAAELAAQQEWAAAHWDVMRLTGDLRAGQVVVR